ncbi:Putative aldehyde reductase [Phytophthora palmivora]|uniref:Aldehyde reductase n=1 Tax=Phytophthora palmivora TaxID=4796 RepID=A0A2P4YAQ8_9STRA|nr:Putative aldehyde reductase [Phytophthora palmivora]
MNVNIPRKKLPSGAEIPVVGLGVYQSEPGPETYNAVLSALKLGYRHIDTAQYYENEADVGRAIKDSGISRDEVFVTSKLSIFNWGYEKAIETTKVSNENLGLGHIDLYLLHAPGDAATRDESWRALEELKEQGILKDIGVSNFGEAHLEKLLKTAKVKPAVNQVELHPWLMRPTLVKYCQDHGILLEAYSPLARAQKMDNPTLLEIAHEVDVSPAQVLVAFSLANGFISLPKSVHEERQKSNLEAATVKLTDAQVAKLASLDEYLVTCWDPIKDHAV